jgi:hypothetical protein
VTATNVREWAREKGYEVKGHGRIPGDLQAQYDAEHIPGGTDPTPPGGAPAGDVLTPDDYGGSVTAADFPPDVNAAADAADYAAEGPPGPIIGAGPVSDQETAPRRIRARAAGGPFARLRGGRDKQDKQDKQPKARRKLPRVSIAGLIEDTWSQMAWAAGPLPPLQRLLYAQAPYAGMALDDAVKGTPVDRVLQPIARAEDKAKAVGGLIMPPAALMAVLVTAPQPRQVDTPEGPQVIWPEPSVQHKGALLSFRWSLMLMAEAGAMHLEEYQAKAAATEERGRAADEFMAWILGMEPPAAVDAVPVREEEEAVRRAQHMFGG